MTARQWTLIVLLLAVGGCVVVEEDDYHAWQDRKIREQADYAEFQEWKKQQAEQADELEEVAVAVFEPENEPESEPEPVVAAAPPEPNPNRFIQTAPEPPKPITLDERVAAVAASGAIHSIDVAANEVRFVTSVWMLMDISLKQETVVLFGRYFKTKRGYERVTILSDCNDTKLATYTPFSGIKILK